MKSTGVYWKPVYYVLEERVICLLVNAAHVKKVPGRKTDPRRRPRPYGFISVDADEDQVEWMRRGRARRHGS